MNRLKLLLNNITSLESELSTLYKQLEQEKDDMFNAIVETAPNFIAIIQNGEFVFVNSKGLTLLNYNTSDNIIGKKVLEILHPDYHAIIKERWQNVLSKKANNLLVIKLLNSNGDYIDLEASSEPFTFKNNPACLIIGRDITNELAQKQKLEDEENLRSVVLNSFPELIAFYEPDHTIRWMNDAAKTFYGITDDSYIGKFCYNVRFDTDEPCADCPMLLKEHVVHERIVHDKNIVWNVRHTPIFNPHGTITGYIELSVDITQKEKRKAEFKEAEQKLKESEQRFREMFENSHDIIFLLEVTNDGRFRYLDLNPAFEKSTESKRSDLIGKFHNEILSEATVKILADYYHYCIEEKKPIVDKEIEINLPSGTRTYIANIIPIYDQNGVVYRILIMTRDITERKQLEILLNKKQSNLEEAQRIGKIGSWELNLQNNNIERSDEIFRIYELEPSRKDFSTEIFLSLIHPEDREKVQNVHSDSVKNKQAYTLEYRLLFTDKRIKYVSESCETYYDEQDNPLRSVGTVQDITERKRMEDALKTSEQEYRSLAENSPDNIIRYNSECRATYGNHIVKTTMNDANSVFLGKTPLECYPNGMYEGGLEEIKNYQTAIEQVLITGEAKELEMHIPTPSGTLQTHLAVFTPERDTQENIVGVLAFGRDITERKRMEEALAKRERDFRTLAENAPDPIYRYDRQCRRVYINPIVERASKIPIDSLLGKTPADGGLVSSSESMKVLKSLQKVLETGERDIIDVLFVSPDGREIWTQNIHVPEFGSDSTVESVLSIGRDITERKQLEQHLKESFLFIETIINSIPEPIFIKDRQHKFILSNDAHNKFRGLTREDFIGKSDFDHFTELEAKPFWDDEEAIFETGKETQYDDFHIDAEGNPFYFVLRKVCFIGSDGQKYLAGTIHDITERKKAEEQLYQREQEFRTLVENSPDIIIRYNKDCNRLYFNPAFQKLADFQASELIGTSPTQLSPLYTDQALIYLNTIKRVFETSQPQSMELRQPKANEEWWYNMMAVPEFDKDGNVTSVLVISRDVTELKKSKEISEMLNFALNNATDAFFIFKVGDPNLIYINDHACQSLGYSKQDLMTKSLFDIDPSMTFEKMAQLDSLIATQGFVKVETIHKQKNGATFPVESTITYYRYKETNYVFIIASDITERKRAEDVLREERKLFIGGPNVAFIWKANDGCPVEYVSPNIFEQFGYTPEELTSNKISFISIVHPDDLPRVAQEVAHYSETKVSYFEQEYRIIRADNEYRWVYDFTVPVRNFNNEITHYKGYLTDITDRKLAEQALHESEQRYRLVFESSPVSIWEEDFSEIKKLFDELKAQGITDIEFYFHQHPEMLQKCGELVKMINVNQSALDLHEASSKQDLLTNLVDTFTPQSFETFKKELVAIWNGLTSMASDAVVKTFTGKERDVTVFFSVCPGYETTLSKILVSLIDVTERKKIEEANRQLNADLSATLKAIPDMLFEVDGDGIYINIWAKETNHVLLDIKQLLGRSLYDVLPSDACEIVKKTMEETRQKGYSFGSVYHLNFPSGRKWFELSVTTKTDFKNTGERFIALVRDITERTLAEEALRESQKRLSKAELIASIGHIEYDFTNGMSYWSDGAFEIFNTPETMRNPEIPVFFEMVVHRDDSERVRNALENAVKEFTKFDEVYRIIDFKGNEKIVHGYGQVQIDDNGTPGNYFGIIQDITIMYNLNAQLFAEEEKFRMLAECSPVGIYISAGKTPVYANKPMLDMVGINSLDSLTNIKLIDLIHPEDRVNIHILSEKLKNEESITSPYKFSLRKLTDDCSIKHFDIYVTTFNIHDTRYLQFIIVDKTEDYENEQIRQQLAASSLYIEQKNKLAGEIESSLKIILASNKKFDKVDFQPISDILRSYSQADKDWELLKTHIENIHPEFVTTLKKYCATLSVNDIKHCACIRLNLDTKEIARFFNVKPSSIQTSRVRLKKKFELPDSTDLREFILSI